MQGQIYQCPGCFTPITAENIDFKTRRAVCPSCGNLVILTRKTLNSSESVLHDLENAVRFFSEHNYDSAKRYAEAALSVAVDNTAALFIIAYYSAYCAENKTRKHIDRFFTETLSDIEFDEEELQAFKTVVLKSVLHVVDYEKIILSKMLESLSVDELAEFTDSFSPYIICKRSNIDYLDSEMTEIYTRITERVDVPKTWYALFQSIIKNPASPELDGTYYLKTKTERFYNEYVLRIGMIFEHIKSEALKAKFNSAFCKKKEEIYSKMYKGGHNL